MLNEEIKYTILSCVFVINFVIPFYYGSGTAFNYGSGYGSCGFGSTIMPLGMFYCPTYLGLLKKQI